MARIVLITLEYAPYRGGVARYLSGLVDRLRVKGHDITVVGPDSGCAVQISLLSRFFWPRWIISLFRMILLVRRIRPDYVMISHVLPMGYTARWIFFALGIPYVVIVHGLDVARPCGWKRWIVASILADAALVVCNSRYTQHIVFSLGVHDSIVVYPGIEDFPSISTLDRCGYAVLSVGRLIERKGFDVLIRAMSYVHECFADATLTIVGTGPDLERLRAVAGNNSYIRFVGAVEDDALDTLYRQSDVFALIPRDIDGDVEGFGMVFLEAALRRLPCIGGRSGGVAEAIIHGETGLVVDPADDRAVAEAIMDLFRDSDMASRLGQQGRERAMSEFLWDVTAVPLCHYVDAHVPLVSVIIPVFNHADELARCIASIRRQLYSHIEIIVVDDGSDEPVQVDDGITLIRQLNHGAPSARNRGFAASHGAFVLFCDADVVMRPDMIRCMVRGLLEHPEASYAYCDFRFGWKRFRTPIRSAEMSLDRNYIHTTALIRRGDFPGFDESLKKFQDWDVWLTLRSRGKHGIRVNSFFTVRQRRGGISAWLPSWMYRFSGLSRVQDYRNAERIIRTKHRV